MDTSKMTKTQLLDKCKELKIIKCNSKSKIELIEFINLKNKLHDFQNEILIDEDTELDIILNNWICD